jgi:methylase of polypeptide subunit release factors
MDNRLDIFIPEGKHTINVYYPENSDGGGIAFGQEYIQLIQERYPNRIFSHCFEWCAGPGFIGFGLLANELCQHLHFMDFYVPAIESINRTVQDNNCADRVSVYIGDDIALLPDVKFDLIVANPPHFPSVHKFKVKSIQKGPVQILDNLQVLTSQEHTCRICVDDHWQAHINFFKHIKSHLTEDGVILLQENTAGSTVDDFKDMIESAGLIVTDLFASPLYSNMLPSIKIYYIEIQHKK